MGARASPEMLRAIELIRQGKSRYEAARLAGVTITGITRSKLYKELQQERKGKTT